MLTKLGKGRKDNNGMENGEHLGGDRGLDMGLKHILWTGVEVRQPK